MKTILGLLAVGLFFISCKKEKGCMDAKASNYNKYAEKDDGTCEYKGCTDKNSLNYDPDALEDDGSCRYPGDAHFYSKKILGSGKYIDLYINGDFVGMLQASCSQEISNCEISCANVDFVNQESTNYTYKSYYIRQLSSGVYDTLETSEGDFFITANTCKAIEI